MSASDPTKILLGKLLGETYRLQRASDVPVPYGDGVVYGLLHGIEHAIDHVLESTGYTSQATLKHVTDVLDPIHQDQAKLKAFKGYYDIEGALQQRGVDRGDAITALRYLYARGSYRELITKMDSEHSPTECRNLTKLDNWD